ncbi:uncharacterized protein FIBRA_05959 [Fibroporia radiculosa]|uniref:Uncharacterized protein n=1 Tax=Fibroporia radiculosa TaxID=599839 RepID=J4GRX7_9APHY|nr:uncharacterized protein FIBRA_05959 [Fibroporia radiculosa]CCM03810.1 predicted protein [Fibroporia radiculosa]
MDPADVHPESKDYDLFVKEYNADITASRLIEAWKNQAPEYPPQAFLADAQLDDYLVIEQRRFSLWLHHERGERFGVIAAPL